MIQTGPVKGWGQNLKGHTKKYKRILHEELVILENIEENEILSSDKLDRKTFIQTELLRLLEEEESYWHKRSNSMWLLKGDNNTTFFIVWLMGKKKNTIFFPE